MDAPQAALHPPPPSLAISRRTTPSGTEEETEGVRCHAKWRLIQLICTRDVAQSALRCLRCTTFSTRKFVSLIPSSSPRLSYSLGNTVCSRSFKSPHASRAFLKIHIDRHVHSDSSYRPSQNHNPLNCTICARILSSRASHTHLHPQGRFRQCVKHLSGLRTFLRTNIFLYLCFANPNPGKKDFLFPRFFSPFPPLPWSLKFSCPFCIPLYLSPPFLPSLNSPFPRLPFSPLLPPRGSTLQPAPLFPLTCFDQLSRAHLPSSTFFHRSCGGVTNITQALWNWGGAGLEGLERGGAEKCEGEGGGR